MIGWLSQLHVSTLSASAIHKRPQPAKPTDGAESPPGCVCGVSRGDERTHDQHTGVTGSLSSTLSSCTISTASHSAPCRQHIIYHLFIVAAVVDHDLNPS